MSIFTKLTFVYTLALVLFLVSRLKFPVQRRVRLTSTEQRALLSVLHLVTSSWQSGVAGTPWRSPEKAHFIFPPLDPPPSPPPCVFHHVPSSPPSPLVTSPHTKHTMRLQVISFCSPQLDGSLSNRCALIQRMRTNTSLGCYGVGRTGSARVHLHKRRPRSSS